MPTLSRHFDFRAHEDRMLTSSAAFWLFSARILVFAMASAEAVAWGYLGFIFSEGPVRWLTGAFMMAIIFLVVWMIDVSLITMDRAWTEHASAILGIKSEEKKSKRRDVLTFGLRIGLLVGSLSVTAPYLAQLVFHSDIEQYNDALAAARIDTARAALSGRFDRSISAKRQEIDTKRSEYENEIAGRGPSGRYGAGPTAAAMERAVTEMESELATLTREKAGALAQFDSLARNPDANRERLATRYNLMLPRQTILGNYAVLQELRKRPEHRQTEWAIKAFLGFIFAGLLLLKLFEPYSVRLYFSEVLQQEYTRYLAGAFDDVLPPSEQSTKTGGAISPQRLYTFLANVWAPAQRLEETRAESHAEVTTAVHALGTVERMRNKAAEELSRRKQQLTESMKARDEALLLLTQLDSAISVVRADVQNLQAQAEHFTAPPETLDDLSYRNTLARKLADARRALRELEEAVPTERDRQRRSEAEMATAQNGLAASTSELESLEKQLRDLRELLARSSSKRARAAFETP